MPRPARIDRGQILEAALALLDEEGIAGLSMRALASRLGVQAASLYNHVSGKDQVRQLVTDALWTAVLNGLAETASWRPLLGQLAARIREVLRAHPGSAQVVAVTNVSHDVYQPVLPQLSRAFAGVGASEEDVLLLVSSLSVLVIGLAAAEFGDTPHPPVAPRDFYDHWFGLAVGTFLDGVAARFETES